MQREKGKMHSETLCKEIKDIWNLNIQRLYFQKIFGALARKFRRSEILKIKSVLPVARITEFAANPNKSNQKVGRLYDKQTTNNAM